MGSTTEAGITITIQDKIQVIRFDNVRRKNAISYLAYSVITDALNYAAEQPEIKVTVFTGTGSYYSSGFDMLDASSQSENADAQKMAVNNLRY